MVFQQTTSQHKKIMALQKTIKITEDSFVTTEFKNINNDKQSIADAVDC